MAVSVTLTGNGAIGQIEPGWTVVEDATPVAPGDSSGSTGQVSFTAKSGKDVDFIVDNGLSFTHDRLGTISGGKVDDLQTGGADQTQSDAEISGGTILSRLAADRTAGPTVEYNYYGQYPINISSGAPPVGMTGAGDEQHVLYATSTAGANTVTAYDLQGNVLFTWGPYGFSTGQINNPTILGTDYFGGNTFYVGNANGTSISVWTRATSGVAPTYSFTFGSSGTGNGQFTNIQSIATDGAGNIYVLDASQYRVQKFNSSGVYQTKWGTNGVGNGQFLAPTSLVVQPSTSSILVADQSRRDIQSFTNTGTFNSIYATNISAFVLATATGNMTTSPIFYATSSTVGRINADGTYATVNFPVNQPVGMIATPGGIFVASGSSTIALRNMYRWFGFEAPRASDVLRYYFALVFGQTFPNGLDFQFNSSTFSTVRFFLPGWTGDVWDHIKQVCSAYGWEIYVEGSGIRLRDLGTLVQAIDNVQEGSISLSLNSQATGLSVDFKNYNTTGGYGTLYDSSIEGTAQSINAGDIQYISLNTNVYGTSVSQPIAVDSIAGAGQYNVSANSTVTNQSAPVPAALWNASGGSVQVFVSDAQGSLTLVVTGPGQDITGFTGPYTIGYAVSGSLVRPTLNIQGTAVFTNPQTVNILTGADPLKTSQQVATSVDNIAHGSVALVYQRATWTTASAAGPNPQLQVVVPTKRVAGFGLCAGSLISFREATYRVSSSRINNDWTSITADRYVTVGQQDSTIDPSGTVTVGQVDTFWNGYSNEDVYIKPLRLVV